ncbi:MAG: hypothetical protein AAF702_20545 [Chloroflexota bacterium]
MPSNKTIAVPLSLTVTVFSLSFIIALPNWSLLMWLGFVGMASILAATIFTICIYLVRKKIAGELPEGLFAVLERILSALFPHADREVLDVMIAKLREYFITRPYFFLWVLLVEVFDFIRIETLEILCTYWRVFTERDLPSRVPLDGNVRLLVNSMWLMERPGIFFLEHNNKPLLMCKSPHAGDLAQEGVSVTLNVEKAGFYNVDRCGIVPINLAFTNQYGEELFRWRTFLSMRNWRLISMLKRATHIDTQLYTMDMRRCSSDPERQHRLKRLLCREHAYVIDTGSI